MPGDRVFVDSNVLLYLHDRKADERRDVARTWLRFLTHRQIATTNLQVLNELAAVFLRKEWFDKPETVFAVVDAFAALGNEPLSRREVHRARAIHRATRYSWWDCLLLASALELRCTHFLSEDLQDGQVIDGLTIVDPFAHTPEQILS